MVEELRLALVLPAVAVAVLLFIRPTWGFLGLVLLMPFLPRFLPRAEHGLNGETVLFLVGVLAVCVRVRPVLPRLNVVAPFIAYYACVLAGFAILMTWYGLRPRGGATLLYWAESLKSELWPTLLFFLAYALAASVGLRRRVLDCIIVGLVIYSASGLFDYVSGAGTAAGATSYRAAGMLAANPNHLGGHLGAFAVLPLMEIFRRGASPLRRWLCGAIYVFAVGVLLLTQSRGSWLGFLVGHSIWLFYTNRKLILPITTGTAVLLVALYNLSLLPAVISERIDDTFTPGHNFYRSRVSGSFDSSVGIRLALYQMGGEMFLDSPLWGHGYQAFRLLNNKYGLKHGVWSLHGSGTVAESVLINVAVESGLIGLAILAWLSFVLLSHALALVRGRGPEATLGLAFLAISLAIGVESLTQNALSVHEISLAFWTTAGLTLRAFNAQRVRALRAPTRLGQISPGLTRRLQPTG
ncbi:MAG: O-antigen ligase family protein [Myxococcota bacterium]